jgi:serine/threonine protein kinase
MTDNVNAVVGSDATSTQPPAKKKVTYILPNQCMEEGHFYIVLGEDVDVSTQRFKILSLLGEGTFGKVVEAWDRKRKEYCAVKIVRSVPKYTRDAKIEIQFMEKVRHADPTDKFPLMKIQRYFQNDQGHMCIVMPKYGPCLLDWLQKNGPFPARQLAEIIFQAGVALDFFHSEMRLMHTDLKPENMLLESAAPVTDPISGRMVPALPCKIRLCDLGGCCDERHSRSAIVSTRHYRSPEVILGLGWMFSTDMWSMGCIIFELATGRLLYDTHDNLEHLHLMEKTLTRLPSDWASKCSEETRSLFTSTGSLRQCTDPKHLSRIARARPIRETVTDELLRDLIYGLLHYDRSKRLTARQMSTHPYVQKYYPESVQHPMHPTNRGAAPTAALS